MTRGSSATAEARSPNVARRVGQERRGRHHVLAEDAVDAQPHPHLFAHRLDVFLSDRPADAEARRRVRRRRGRKGAIALGAGFLTTLGSTLLVARLAGLEPILQRSIAPKAITAPVAMGVAERIGGLPTMTAVFAVLTGVTGAVVAVPLLARLRVVDDAAKGLAIGLVSHGIGTARAFRISERAGAYAGWRWRCRRPSAPSCRRGSSRWRCAEGRAIGRHVRKR